MWHLLEVVTFELNRNYSNPWYTGLLKESEGLFWGCSQINAVAAYPKGMLIPLPCTLREGETILMKRVKVAKNYQGKISL